MPADDMGRFGVKVIRGWSSMSLGGEVGVRCGASLGCPGMFKTLLNRFTPVMAG